MQEKMKVLNLTTIVSSIITIILVITCIIANKEFWNITILFISITQMLVAINHYEIAKNVDGKKYRLLGDVCMISAMIILGVAIFWL